MFTVQAKCRPGDVVETCETHRLAAAAALRCPRGGSKIAFKIPIRAKFLNSSTRDQVWRVGTTDAISLIGSLDSARLNGLIIYFLSARGSPDAALPLREGATSSHCTRARDERCASSLRRVCPMPGKKW